MHLLLVGSVALALGAGAVVLAIFGRGAPDAQGPAPQPSAWRSRAEAFAVPEPPAGLNAPVNAAPGAEARTSQAGRGDAGNNGAQTRRARTRDTGAGSRAPERGAPGSSWLPGGDAWRRLPDPPWGRASPGERDRTDAAPGLRPAPPVHRSGGGPESPDRFSLRLETTFSAEQRGHRGPITDLVFTPDGRAVISASEDRTLRRWDPRTGIALLTYTGHRGPVLAAAVTRSGATLVSAGTDETVRIWEAASANQRATYRPQRASTSAIALLPDGARAISGGRDDRLTVFELSTGKVVRRFEAHQGGVLALAIAPSGARIACGGRDDSVRLFDVQTGALLTKLSGHLGDLTRVAFTPDGLAVVSTAADGRAIVWDLDTGKPRLRLAHGRSVRALAIHPEGATIATGGADGRIRLWDRQTGERRRTWRAHRRAVTALAYSPDGHWLVSGSEDRTIVLWDAATGTLLRRFAAEPGGIAALALGDAGRVLVSGGEDDVLTLWDTRSGRVRRMLAGHQASVTAVDVWADGRFVLSGSADERVRLWDAEAGTLLAELAGHRDPVTAVAFAPGTARTPGVFASASLDGTVRLWERNAEGNVVPRAVLAEHTDGVCAIAFSADGRRLFSAGLDGTVREFTVRAGRERSAVVIGAAATCLAVGPGGRWAVGDARGAVRLGSASGAGPPQPVSGTSAIVALAFSADGTRLAAVARDGTVGVYDGRTLERLARTTLEGRPRAVRFDPRDATRLYLGDRDGRLTRYRLASR